MPLASPSMFRALAVSLSCVGLVGLGLALSGSSGQEPAPVSPFPPWHAGTGPLLPSDLGGKGGNRTPVEAPEPADLVQDPVSMRFGIDAGGAHDFSRLAGSPDYGTMWVGAWNLDVGWRGTETALAGLAAINVTPAIQVYYWGNDIRPSCFEVGCNGKSVAEWQQMARELTGVLSREMDGKPVLLLLESEFNKNGVERDDVLDGLLVDEIGLLKQGYPNAQVVLSFGNWNDDAWPIWDRAAAASDYVGVQALTASTRHDGAHQVALAESTLKAAQRLHEVFQKPVILQDVGISTYQGPDQLEIQADALQAFADRFGDFQDAGVEAILYRALKDTPSATTAEYFGEAERHWGLAWTDGTLKPGGETWVAAVREVRGLPPVSA